MLMLLIYSRVSYSWLAAVALLGESSLMSFPFPSGPMW